MARKQCQVCGQPATVRVEANLNGRHSTMLLCDDHYRQLVRQQKRTVSPLEALFGSRSGLFEDFLGSDFFRIGDDAPSMAADTDEVVDASFGEPAPAGTGTARRRGSGLASRISEQSEALLQEAARHAAEFGRAEVDTEHLLLALIDSDVVKTILGQFKIKVDDLKRQIESEAKRGDKPFEGEIGVSPRVKDALSRAFVASNELGHSYVGPEHFLIGLAEEGEGLAANLLRRYGLTPQALRQRDMHRGQRGDHRKHRNPGPRIDHQHGRGEHQDHGGGGEKFDQALGRALGQLLDFLQRAAELALIAGQFLVHREPQQRGKGRQQQRTLQPQPGTRRQQPSRQRAGGIGERDADDRRPDGSDHGGVARGKHAVDQVGEQHRRHQRQPRQHHRGDCRRQDQAALTPAESRDQAKDRVQARRARRRDIGQEGRQLIRIGLAGVIVTDFPEAAPWRPPAARRWRVRSSRTGRWD